MNEHEKLSNPDNYKIIIKLKKKRKNKLNERYLTDDLSFSENINEATIFKNFQDAEQIIDSIYPDYPVGDKPRITVVYTDKDDIKPEMSEQNVKTTKTHTNKSDK